MSHSGRAWTQQHQEQLTMSVGRCLAVASSTRIPSDAKSASEFPLVCRDGIRCPPPRLSDRRMKQGQLEGRRGRAAQDSRSATPRGPSRARSPSFPWPFNHTEFTPFPCPVLPSRTWDWRGVASTVFTGKHGEVWGSPVLPRSTQVVAGTGEQGRVSDGGGSLSKPYLT